MDNTPIDISLGKEIVILIGAGASVDHSKSITTCPPLGWELGKRMREYLPEFRDVETKVSIPCGEDFEAWMEVINSTNPVNYTDVLWCLSKYFCHFNDLTDDSLYIKLIDRLGWETLQKMLFVSLNYETLLELAIRKMGYRAHTGTNFDNFRDQTLIDKQPEIPIIKPHGSCHYRVQLGVNIQILDGVKFERFAVTDSSGSLDLGNTLAQDPMLVEKELNEINNSLPSVVSAYNPEKSTNFNRSFIQGLRDTLINRITSCQKIVIIGMNYRENDEYINKVVRVSLATGATLGFAGDKEAFDKYCNLCYVKGVSHQYLGNRFRESFDKLIRFLKD